MSSGDGTSAVLLLATRYFGSVLRLFLDSAERVIHDRSSEALFGFCRTSTLVVKARKIRCGHFVTAKR